MNTKLDALLDTLDALDHPLPSDLVAFMQSLPPQGTLPSPWMTWTLFGLMRFRCAALKPPQFSLCPMFIRKHSLGFLIALCFASLLNSLALAQRPAVKELSDGVDLRHATYRDLKFVYDVRYKTEISPTPPPAIDTSGGFVSARDVFKLSGGTSVAKPEKWNSSWVRTSSRGLGQQAMTDFYVTDDETVEPSRHWGLPTGPGIARTSSPADNASEWPLPEPPSCSPASSLRTSRPETWTALPETMSSIFWKISIKKAKS